MKKNLSVEKVVIGCFVFYLLLKDRIVLATTSPTGPFITIPNPLKSGTDSLYDFISLIINEVILPVGGVIAVIYIIYAGFLLVTARGDEAKLTQGKRAFMYAAIGTLVLLGAWAISQAIEGTVNQLIG